MSDDLPIKDLVRTPPTELLAWSVMMLISRNAPDDFLKRFGIDASNHDNTVKVELFINGVEVSPREVFAELSRQHEEMVKREAADMIRDKLRAPIAMMEHIEELVRREAASALGVNWEDRW